MFEAERFTPSRPVDVLVRDVALSEMAACQALQRRAWGITAEGYVLPVATMAAAQRVGGLVLGAFDEREHLLGFSFAFLGRLRGRLVLYSQLTAVDPGAQGRGVGRAIKLTQRQRALEMGLEVVAWAFDPLQAGNAAFNLAVLGAVSRTYEVDLYGPRADALNAGLPTDRLVVEWTTAGALGGRGEPWPDAVDLVAIDGSLPVARSIPVGARRLHLPVPGDLLAVAIAGDARARAWQHAVRAAFQAAFDAGFVAVGFARGSGQQLPRYLLERRAG